MKDAADTIRRLRRLTRLMDSSIRLPGTRYRFGLDPLVGLIPGVGDAIGLGVSLWIVTEARRLGVSGPTLTRMLLNAAADTVVGAIPVLGDLFDAGYKANQRNLELLEEDLRRRGAGGPLP